MNLRVLNLLEDAGAVYYNEEGEPVSMALVGEDALVNLFDLIVKDICTLLEAGQHTVVDKLVMAELIKKRYQ